MMKKLVLSMVLAGFAAAAQAGNDGCCGAGSCSTAQTASAQAKPQCTLAKQAKNACPKAQKAAKQASVKRPLKSPKAMG